ncbi:ABC transporter permease [Spirochaetia bacterium]|nr:ABC transporter permease [Spirochaetia bacterium]
MSKIKFTAGERIFDIYNIIFLVLFSCIMIYPFIHVTSVAFSSKTEAIRPGLHLYPKEIDLSSIKKILTTPEILNAYRNTIFRTVVGTILSVVCTGMGAYALSKRSLPFRKFIMSIILFAMFFSGGMIPEYLLIRNLGLINSMWAMILPSLVWGMNLIIMKNFFDAIPDSLEESAKLDGANDFIILVRVYFPLSKPVIATIAMWMAVHHWNAYMDNLLYITDNRKYVLQRMIRNLIIDAQVSYMESMSSNAALSLESLKSATILISILPIIMVYPFVQKYFIKGVMIGAVKG